MRLPLRVRVATAFGAAAAVLLGGLGWVVYAGVERTLVERAQDGLVGRLDSLVAASPSVRADMLAGLDRDYVAQVLTSSGSVVANSATAPTPLIDMPARPGLTERHAVLAGETEPEDLLLAVARSGNETVVVGTSKEDVADALQEVLVVASTAGVVGLALALLVGYVVAGVALRPVERMRARAATISAERSGARLPVPPARDELRRLGLTLNDMLDRLEKGLQRERRFVAEAGHELRTPLALLRTEIELALVGDRTRDELLAALHSAGEEVDRLTALAESLLLLSSAGAERAPVDVSELARETTERFRGTASKVARAVVVTGEDGLVVQADRESLERAFANLVDNALRHGAGTVAVDCTARDGGVRVVVADDGTLDPLVGSSAERPLVRSGTSRARGGAGLGLAISSEVATQHGGTLTLRSRPAGGTEAVLWLPVAT